MTRHPRWKGLRHGTLCMLLQARRLGRWNLAKVARVLQKPTLLPKLGTTELVIIMGTVADSDRTVRASTNPKGDVILIRACRLVVKRLEVSFGALLMHPPLTRDKLQLETRPGSCGGVSELVSTNTSVVFSIAY